MYLKTQAIHLFTLFDPKTSTAQHTLEPKGMPDPILA